MRISDEAIEIELDKRYPENSYNGYMKQGFYDGFKAALSAEPAQAKFDSAEWFCRDNDPDDSGDTPHEAITHHPEYSVHLVHSSYRGDSRYVFRAPTLDPSDDDDEVLDFETEEEAIAAAHERRAEIERLLPAAPTTEASR